MLWRLLTQCLQKDTNHIWDAGEISHGLNFCLTPTYFYSMEFFVALLVLRAHSPQTVYMQFSKMSPSVFSLPFGQVAWMLGRQQAERSPRFHLSSLSLMRLWFLSSLFVQDVIIDRQTICSALRILICLSLTSCCSLPVWLVMAWCVSVHAKLTSPIMLHHHNPALLRSHTISHIHTPGPWRNLCGKPEGLGHVSINI